MIYIGISHERTILAARHCCCVLIMIAQYLLGFLPAVGHYAAYCWCAGCTSKARFLRMFMSNLTVRIHVHCFGLRCGT